MTVYLLSPVLPNLHLSVQKSHYCLHSLHLHLRQQQKQKHWSHSVKHYSHLHLLRLLQSLQCLHYQKHWKQKHLLHSLWLLQQKHYQMLDLPLQLQCLQKSPHLQHFGMHLQQNQRRIMRNVQHCNPYCLPYRPSLSPTVVLTQHCLMRWQQRSVHHSLQSLRYLQTNLHCLRMHPLVVRSIQKNNLHFQQDRPLLLPIHLHECYSNLHCPHLLLILLLLILPVQVPFVPLRLPLVLLV